MAKSADAFRTISEVADWLGVQTHVLRFWESKFTQVKPVKRAGGRRYYRPVDMLLLGGIQKLLHEDGLTIKGVQKILREKGIAHVSALSPAVDGVVSGDVEVAKPVKPAPFEQAALDEAEPPTAEVVPFVQDPRPSDVAEPVDRPSFTQDAVVMPDTPAEAAETTEPKGSVPSTAPSVKDKADTLPEETVETEEITSQEATAAPETPETSVPQATDVSKDTQNALTETLNETAAAPDPEIEAPAVAVPEQQVVEIEAETVSAPEEATPATAHEEPPEIADEEPIAVLPSFLSRSPRPAAPVTDNLPPKDETVEFVQSVKTPDDVAVPDEPVIEATKPKPAIVDIPDAPFEPEIAASPRALSALAKVKSLTPAQASAIAPLLAQLRTVRDRMGAGRKE